MPTAYIDTHIEAAIGSVHLFELDAVAEIEYQVNRRDGLTDWYINDFKFEKFRYDVERGEYKPVKVAEVWCSDELRPLLLKYANSDKIEEALIEYLTANGEITYPGAGLRADYHAAVL